MAVGVQCDRHTGMAQTFAHDLGAASLLHHHCRVSVPQIMQTDMRESSPLDEIGECVRDSVWIHYTAVELGEYIVRFLPLHLGGRSRRLRRLPVSPSLPSLYEPDLLYFRARTLLGQHFPPHRLFPCPQRKVLPMFPVFYVTSLPGLYRLVPPPPLTGES